MQLMEHYEAKKYQDSRLPEERECQQRRHPKPGPRAVESNRTGRRRSGTGSGITRDVPPDQKKKIFLVGGGEKTLRSSSIKPTSGRNINKEVDELMDDQSESESEFPNTQPRDAQNIEEQALAEDLVLTPSPPRPNQLHQRREEIREVESETESEVMFSSVQDQEPRQGGVGFDRREDGEQMETAPLPTNNNIPGLDDISRLLDSKLRDVARTGQVSAAVKVVAERVERNEGRIRRLEARLDAIESNTRGTVSPPPEPSGEEERSP